MPGGPLWDAGDSQRLLLRAHESSTLFSSATLLSGDLSSDSYDSNAASSTSTSRVPWLLQLDDFFDATEAAALVRAGDEAGFDAAAEQSYSKATGRSGRTPLSASRRNSSAAKVTIEKIDAAAASHVGNVVGRLERLLGAPRSHFEGFLVAAHVKCDCEGPSARFAFSTRRSRMAEAQGCPGLGSATASAAWRRTAATLSAAVPYRCTHAGAQVRRGPVVRSAPRRQPRRRAEAADSLPLCAAFGARSLG